MSDSIGFSGVHFWVSDMGASVAFYRLLGFTIEAGAEQQPFTRVGAGEGIAFAFGSLALTRGYDPAFQPSRVRGATCLQFDVASREAVDELHARLVAAGHLSHLAPMDAFWGSRYAEVLDPDGNAVGFHSPRDDSRVTLPPL